MRSNLELDAIHYVNFPFQEVEKSKFRPAIIVEITGPKVTVVPLFTRPRSGRILIRATYETGLRHDSYIDPTRRLSISSCDVKARIGNLPYTPQLEQALGLAA